MAKHLTTIDIKKILAVIDGWSDKLAWDTLCDELVNVIGTRPTRQTLNANISVKEAFLQKKARLKAGAPVLKQPQSLKIAAQRIKRLEEQNARLENENARLLEQFVVWQYNAYSHGITMEKLCNPLPEIDRDSSEKNKRHKSKK